MGKNSAHIAAKAILTARTLREIENIKRNRTNIAVERPVPVAVFA
jgi:hypothetical protein